MGILSSTYKDNIVSPIAFSPPICSYDDLEGLIFLNDIACFHIQTEGKYTIIYSHGNACDIGKVYPFMKSLSEKYNVNVIAYDYYGYGLNQSNRLKDIRPNEENTYEAINTVYRYLTENLGVSSKNIVLYGTSIGTGPTCYLAKNKELKAVILEAPYKSLTSIVSDTLAYSSAMINPETDMFPNIYNIKSIICPIYIFHGTEDRVIPVEHSKSLARKNRRVRYYEIEGAGHNNITQYQIFYTVLQTIF